MLETGHHELCILKKGNSVNAACIYSVLCPFAPIVFFSGFIVVEKAPKSGSFSSYFQEIIES